MLPRPMHFTLRGIPTPPAERGQEIRQRERAEKGPASPCPEESPATAKAHHGWIDLLLGDTSLDDLYPDDD